MPEAEAPPDRLHLDERIEDIDQRARIVERKLDLAQEESAKRSAELPVLSAGDKGFAFGSPDGAFQVKVRGLLQGDDRIFLADDAMQQKDTFVVRRARPILEASFSDLADVRFMPDFGNGQVLVMDAYADLRPWSWLRLRAGKFKPPIGLERLQGAANIVFVERGLPTALVPNRDVGAQLHGEIVGGTINYAFGIFNGVVDGGSGDLDNNAGKDFAGRLFLQPLKRNPYTALQGLGFGVAGSIGEQNGAAPIYKGLPDAPKLATASSPGLPTFKSAGQQTVFSYLVNDEIPDATVIAEGRRVRISPQGYFYVGWLGLLGEYVSSSQSVRKGGQSQSLHHQAWQLAASVVLTGDRNSYEGVQVKRPFDPRRGGVGAIELAGRYNQLTLDAGAFPTFADPNKAVREARGAAIALRWHWNRNVRLDLNFERTTFAGGASSAADRTPESIVLQRTQISF